MSTGGLVPVLALAQSAGPRRVHPAWGHRKIWALTHHDGHVVSEATVLRILREEGLILPDTYQRERRQLAARRKAAFATEPTGANQVWQLDFSPVSRPPAAGRGGSRAVGTTGPSTSTAGTSRQQRTSSTPSRPSSWRWPTQHGRVDILVSSAGIRAITPALDITPAEWQRTIAVNLNGTFYCAQSAARIMARASRGTIITVASTSGLQAAPERASYCASKFGVIGMTQAMAADLGHYGVRVNALCPGVVPTPLTEPYFTDPTLGRKLTQAVPLGALGAAADVANAALFLASDLASHLTGVSLPVDGGFLASKSPLGG